MARVLYGSFLSWFTNFAARRLEWVLSFYTIYFGALLLMPPISMSSRSFAYTTYVMSENKWGLLYFTVGCLHAIALHINGRAAWTPFARLASLFINSQVLLALSVSLARVDVWATGPHTYGFIGLVFCGVAMYSAAFDCGREYSIWRGQRRGQLSK